MSTYLERILKARVYDVAEETPLDAAPRLSARLGNRILLKREDLQPVFSFKIRGCSIQPGPPQRSQRVTSIRNTRASRCTHVMALCRSAGGPFGGWWGRFPGTISGRHCACGANTP